MSDHANKTPQQSTLKQTPTPLPQHQPEEQFENAIHAIDFSKSNADAPTIKATAIVQLQRTIGNRAVQRLLNTGRIKAPVVATGLPALPGVTPLPIQSLPSPALALRETVLARAFAPAETDADIVPSPALQLRSTLQPARTPHIQRDIKGSAKLASGTMEIDYTKFEGAVPGDPAGETGTITFTPNAKAQPSKSLRFIQIVRNKERDKTGKQIPYTYLASEKDLQGSETTANSKKNIAGGFFVDREPGFLKKRTKKSDKNVEPFYDVTGPPIAGNKTGATGKAPTPAVLDDTPSTSIPLIYQFVSAVKGSDNNVWYGTVLWGFETFVNKAGVTKVKGEYKKFRNSEGATMTEALKQYDEYYRNKGASTAPKK